MIFNEFELLALKEGLCLLKEKDKINILTKEEYEKIEIKIKNALDNIKYIKWFSINGLMDI